MMWFFFIDVFGDCPAGNDGAVRPHIGKSEKVRREFAASWKGCRRGRVYGMSVWTQQMCELGPAAFARYIESHGKLYA